MFHLQIAIYIIALITGAFVIHFLYSRYKECNFIYLKMYLFHMVCIGLVVLCYLFSDYYKINLSEILNARTSSTAAFFQNYRGVLIQAIRIFAIIGFGFTLIKMIFQIQDKKSSRLARVFLLLFPAGVFCVYLVLLINFFLTRDQMHLFNADFAVSFLVFFLILSYIISGYFQIRKSTNTESGKILRNLLFFYFGSIVLMIFNEAFFSQYYFIVRGLVLYLWTLFPVIWLQNSYFKKMRNNLFNFDTFDIDRFGNEYDLSARERDVFKLILQGYANKEVQDKLFIALHTVKNHNYSIYKKLGIRGRGELFRYVSDWANKNKMSLTPQ